MIRSKTRSLKRSLTHALDPAVENLRLLRDSLEPVAGVAHRTIEPPGSGFPNSPPKTPGPDGENGPASWNCVRHPSGRSAPSPSQARRFVGPIFPKTQPEPPPEREGEHMPLIGRRPRRHQVHSRCSEAIHPRIRPVLAGCANPGRRILKRQSHFNCLWNTCFVFSPN